MAEMGLAVREEIEKASDQLVKLQAEGNVLQFQADSLTIQTEQDVAKGRQMLSDIGTVKKKITAYIKPVKKAFEDFIKRFSEGATAADTIIRAKLNGYAIEQELIRRAEEERLREQQRQRMIAAQKEAEKAAKNNQPPPPPPPPPLPIHVESPTDEGFRTYWNWRVVDRDKIPDKYWLRVLNEKLLNEEVTEQKEHFAAPGIETYTVKKVVASR